MKKRQKNFKEFHSQLLDLEIRWPKKGDRLVRPSGDWSREVEFVSRPASKHVLMWDGYLHAAAGLIDLCNTEGYEHERHAAIYPILFNYRHGLELAMKWIIRKYDDQDDEGVNVGHNLWRLWISCRRIMEAFGSPDSELDDAVGQIIKDFHDLDKSGMSFRYGWRKDGGEIKLSDHLIDLDNIRDVMDGVAVYFNGCDGWLDDLQSAGP